MIDQVPIDTPKETNAMLHFLTFIPQLAYKKKTTYFFLDMDLGFSLLRKLFPNLPAFGEMGWVILGTYPRKEA